VGYSISRVRGGSLTERGVAEAPSTGFISPLDSRAAES
jgi:hypothetical protein